MSSPLPLAVTYAPVGATRDPGSRAWSPAGYRPVERTVPLGTGRACFDRAVAATMTWGIQRGSGIRVRVPRAAPGAWLGVGDVVLMRVPLWPSDVPCEVVYVVDEPTRAGFAYGTLPGHPERGEEAFFIELLPDDTVQLRIRAFSRSSSWVFRVGYPAVRLMQSTYTERYLRALNGI